MEVTVITGQSLFDIAIQTCGSIEAVYEIAKDNNVSITDDLTVGQVLQIPPPINKPIAEYTG